MLSRVGQVVHVDMDAFYASVEQRDRPELRGRPVLVGGAGRRGVVAAASYEARPRGVRSAMSMVEALRRCPDAAVVPPRMSRYADVSRDVFAIFRRYTPEVEALSIDEAFLDVTASRALFGDGRDIARRIKEDIRRELRLPATAGIAPSKFVAKIASNLGKPDGLLEVRDPVADFLAPLPIELMWGVGKKAGAKLKRAGIHTFRDLARADPQQLRALLGRWGLKASALARGEDPRSVRTDRGRKSISAEQTFAHDRTSIEELEPMILAQSERVAQRAVRADACGSVVTLKLKYTDFQIRTRQTQLPHPVQDTPTIASAAKRLLREFPNLKRGIRLTGVALSGLHKGPPPKTLLPDAEGDRRQQLEGVVATLRSRFGDDKIVRATLMGAAMGIASRDPSAEHPSDP